MHQPPLPHRIGQQLEQQLEQWTTIYCCPLAVSLCTVLQRALCKWQHGFCLGTMQLTTKEALKSDL